MAGACWLTSRSGRSAPGLTATPEQAQAAHAFIRGWLGQDVRRGDRGPGCCPVRRERQAGQRRRALACPDIDGALVGGASLKAADFLAIIQAGQDVTAAAKPEHSRITVPHASGSSADAES